MPKISKQASRLGSIAGFWIQSICCLAVVVFTPCEQPRNIQVGCDDHILPRERKGSPCDKLNGPALAPVVRLNSNGVA